MNAAIGLLILTLVLIIASQGHVIARQRRDPWRELERRERRR